MRDTDRAESKREEIAVAKRPIDFSVVFFLAFPRVRDRKVSLSQSGLLENRSEKLGQQGPNRGRTRKKGRKEIDIIGGGKEKGKLKGAKHWTTKKMRKRFHTPTKHESH